MSWSQRLSLDQEQLVEYNPYIAKIIVLTWPTWNVSTKYSLKNDFIVISIVMDAQEGPLTKLLINVLIW